MKIEKDKSEIRRRVWEYRRRQRRRRRCGMREEGWGSKEQVHWARAEAAVFLYLAGSIAVRAVTLGGGQACAQNLRRWIRRGVHWRLVDTGGGLYICAILKGLGSMLGGKKGIN
ncbi:unnamed protein product [Coffea canephora]|uniref:Uncharacterized protein n=1 Tax=Coffea canephora TaxID=49390 RepID=A0A068TMR1_COFCA|nr:unnamed protein product [Coffea canephora]